MTNSAGRRYFDKMIAEGKTHKEAKRCPTEIHPSVLPIATSNAVKPIKRADPHPRGNPQAVDLGVLRYQLTKSAYLVSSGGQGGARTHHSAGSYPKKEGYLRTACTPCTVLCMSSTVYETVSEARAHMKEILDAAHERLPVRIRRGARQVVVVDEELFHELVSRTYAVPAPQVYEENDGWTIVLPGTPISADSTDFNECVDDFVAALEDYVTDWISDAELRHARSHRRNAALVSLVESLTHEGLRSWVLGDYSLEGDRAAHVEKRV